MWAVSVGAGPVPARWPLRASVPIIFKNNPHNLNNFLTTEKKQGQHPGRKRPSAENIKYRLNSGKAQFMAKGGKVGRKNGYKKPDEKFREEYAAVIKQLRKGYPIRMVAASCGVGISTVQRVKKKFINEE